MTTTASFKSSFTKFTPTDPFASVNSIQSIGAIRNTSEESLIELAHLNQFRKIRLLLQREVNLPILALKDNRQQTLIHIACLNNYFELCKLFISYAKVQGNTLSSIKDWLNMKTGEGFVAIHFAAYKGNIELMKLLEEYGASFVEKNKRGLNPLLVAAQGDQPISMAYLLKKGLTVQDKDYSGNTALHWASYFGMENAVNFLISWKTDLEDVDYSFNCTPLHLAVNSGNIRVVRKLLVKGANRHAKNLEDKMPIDIAAEEGHDAIVDMLRPKNIIFSYLGMSSGKRVKTRVPLSITIFIGLLLIIANSVFLFPYMNSITMIIISSIFMATTVGSFLFTWWRDPGTVSTEDKKDDLELLMKNEPHTICPDCVLVKPQRSRHCDYCEACVSTYDHHCPWVNNCIGANNYNTFFVLIVSSMLNVLNLIVLSSLMLRMGQLDINYPSLFSLENFEVFMTGKNVVYIMNITIGGLLVFPLGFLTFMHIANMVHGTTTSERAQITFNIDVNATSDISVMIMNEKAKQPQKWYQKLSTVCKSKKDGKVDLTPATMEQSDVYNKIEIFQASIRSKDLV